MKDRTQKDEYIFSTRRCGIRELTQADIPAEFMLYSGEDMTDHIPPLSDPEKEVKLCREYARLIYRRFGFGMWGVFDLDSGRLIGEAGLEKRFDVDREKYPYDWMFEDDCAEIGFMIARDLWGEGYCSEVCLKILDHCHEHFGINDVFARTDPDNTASVSVLKKLGFILSEHMDNGKDLYRRTL